MRFMAWNAPGKTHRLLDAGPGGQCQPAAGVGRRVDRKRSFLRPVRPVWASWCGRNSSNPALASITSRRRTPEFIACMVAEARQIIPSRRNHPSLAIWCGGNELSRKPDKPLDDSHPMLAALKAVVLRSGLRTASGCRPRLQGPVFGNSLEEIEKNPDQPA